MSTEKMEHAVRQTSLPEGDAAWFARWHLRSTRWTRQLSAEFTEMHEEELIQLLRLLRDSGRQPFARLPVVRSLVFYQQQILQIDTPDLSPIRLKLEEPDRPEHVDRSKPVAAAPDMDELDERPAEHGDKMLVGLIDPDEPALLRQVRTLMRVRHDSARTERSYADWIRRLPLTGRPGGSTVLQASGQLPVECDQ